MFKKLRVLIIVGVIMVILMVCLNIVCQFNSCCIIIESSLTCSFCIYYNDFIQGVKSIPIALTAFASVSITVFIFNRNSKRQNKNEFNSRFIELLNNREKIVSQLNINDQYKGVKCFVHLEKELRLANFILNEINNILDYDDKLNTDELFKLSYNIFFYGTGENSEKYYFHDLNKKKAALFYFKLIKRNFYYKNNDPKPLRFKAQFYFSIEIEMEQKKDELNKKLLSIEMRKKLIKVFENTKVEIKKNPFLYSYPFFEGHVNNLGRYFRHSYFLISTLKNNNVGLTPEDKRNYVKMIRTNTTDFEQLLVYYNAVALFRNKWIDAIVEYSYIRNVPYPLIDLKGVKKPHIEFREKIIKVLSDQGVEQVKLKMFFYCCKMPLIRILNSKVQNKEKYVNRYMKKFIEDKNKNDKISNFYMFGLDDFNSFKDQFSDFILINDKNESEIKDFEYHLADIFGFVNYQNY